MTRKEIEACKEADLWADIPDFPREDWRDEAGAGDTQLGYWDWVESQLSQREDEILNATSFPAEDITTYLEIANEALKDGNFFDHCAEALDTSDEEMVRLREQLQKHMGAVPE